MLDLKYLKILGYSLFSPWRFNLIGYIYYEMPGNLQVDYNQGFILEFQLDFNLLLNGKLKFNKLILDKLSL